MVIFTLGIVKRDDKKTTAHEYFLKSNTLRWPAIAFSTISTNIHAGHFIGMAGSAYLYGLVQANFEINAILGILIAAFVFIPIYLAANVTTISQFFEQRLGLKVALSTSNIMEMGWLKIWPLTTSATGGEIIKLQPLKKNLDEKILVGWDSLLKTGKKEVKRKDALIKNK